MTARLALLVASMRAGGARLGLGDLISAHRALAAVDPSSRADSRRALRAALCKQRSDLELFDAAFDGVSSPPPSVEVQVPRSLRARPARRRGHQC